MKQNITEELKVFENIRYNSIYSENTYNEIITYFINYLMENNKKGNKKKLIVLDAGCGEADFGVRLVNNLRNGTLVALDVSMNLIKNIDSKAAQKLQGDAMHLPLKDKSIDIIIAAAIIHHFPNYIQLLLEFKRVLSANASLLIFEPNGNSIKEMTCYLIGRHFKKNIFTKNEKPIPPFKLKKLLSKNGFYKINIKPIKITYKKNGEKMFIGKLLELIDKINPRKYSTYPFYLINSKYGGK